MKDYPKTTRRQVLSGAAAAIPAVVIGGAALPAVAGGVFSKDEAIIRNVERLRVGYRIYDASTNRSDEACEEFHATVESPAYDVLDVSRPESLEGCVQALVVVEDIIRQGFIGDPIGALGLPLSPFEHLTNLDHTRAWLVRGVMDHLRDLQGRERVRDVPSGRAI